MITLSVNGADERHLPRGPSVAAIQLREVEAGSSPESKSGR